MLTLLLGIPLLTIAVILLRWESPTATLALITSALAILLLLLAMKKTPPPLRPAISHEEASSAALRRDISDLQAKIDLLSAEREVSLVLNQDVDFKIILQSVLEITSGLIGGRGNEEIVIFLKEEATERLTAKAARINGETLFDQQLAEESRVATDDITSAPMEHGRQILTANNDILDIIAPLTADRDFIGVVRVRVPLEGDRAERDGKIERLSHIFDEFAKFVSLAVKTPDLYTRAVEDGLTKLATKRHFLNQLDQCVDTAGRYNEPLSLIMIDIDHFKKINDTYGHQSGDIVLKEVADVIRKNLRKSGDAAYSGYRYGGEELSIILPKTAIDKAEVVADRLRKAVETKTMRGAKGESIKVTVSLGIAQWQRTMNTPGDFISSADEALYQAKESGRNRVCLNRGA